MKRVLFTSNNDYKPSTRHISDPLFIPLGIINDVKAQKNGTKKTVFWVKKKKKEEDGTVKGEKWQTSQQYIGDWKENKKHGYGIKIYDNKDKYEGFWDNDLRNGKGTYWVCIGKNKYRKLYTGDWKNNQKEGHGIFFYKDGSCYDGQWKNSKRDGKGWMIYHNEDMYSGSWQEDLKHGYGILEKQNGDKYYGYWNLGLKEGQGYYYYNSTGKIYLGQWHEDNPRCGIFADVEDETVKAEIEKWNLDPNDVKEWKDHREIPSEMPKLNLLAPEEILEESINNVHFIRNIKIVKTKNLQELFNSDQQKEIIRMYSQLKATTVRDDDWDNKIPDYTITLPELKAIIYNNWSYDLSNEVMELIFYAFGISITDKTEVDFLWFVKIYYLIYEKIQNENAEEEEGEEGEDGEGGVIGEEGDDVNVINQNMDQEEGNQRYMEEISESQN